jgi:hypothetical protein
VAERDASEDDEAGEDEHSAIYGHVEFLFSAEGREWRTGGHGRGVRA